MTAPLRHRKARFDLDGCDPAWTPGKPEFAYAANAVSLAMPYVEPYICRNVEAAVPSIPDGEVRGDAEEFVRQERQHYGQHARWNRTVTRRWPALRKVEDLMEHTFAWMELRLPPRFNLAWSAALETVAYTAARWAAAHRALLEGSDPEPSRLFRWHLAEEAEHRSVVHDVYWSTGGGRLVYVAALLSAAYLLASFVLMGTLTVLWHERRILNPVSHLRLAWWAVTFLRYLLPGMARAALPGFHPSRLPGHPALDEWLAEAEAAFPSR